MVRKFCSFTFIYIYIYIYGGEKIEVTRHCKMKVERKLLKTQIKVTLIADIFFLNFILSVEFITKAWNFNNGV